MKPALIAAEAAWIKKFKLVLRSMPASLEVVVTHGSVNICAAGAMKKHLALDTGWGTAEDLDSVRHPRVIPHSECI